MPRYYNPTDVKRNSFHYPTYRAVHETRMKHEATLTIF